MSLWCHWIWCVYTRSVLDMTFWPVDVDECETVPHVFLHLAAVVLLSIVGSTQADVLPVLPPPGDGGPVMSQSPLVPALPPNMFLLWSSSRVTVESDGPALCCQGVSTARLVDDVGRNYKWNQIKMQFIQALNVHCREAFILVRSCQWLKEGKERREAREQKSNHLVENFPPSC